MGLRPGCIGAEAGARCTNCAATWVRPAQKRHCWRREGLFRSMLPLLLLLAPPSISSLDYGRALSGEREMLWQRQAHTRRAGGEEQRVSWQLRELSFSTPGTGCTHGLSEPWPQPALDGQSQASAHADLNRVPALAFPVCARSYWRSLVIQLCLTPTQRDILLLPCASYDFSAWVFLRTLG